jgi:hypothetical protein
MSTIVDHPCLFINNDEDKATTLHVNLLDPPFWKDFELKPTIKRLKIQGDEDRDIDTTEEMLLLFLALQPHSGIESFEFHNCEIKELGHLVYWWKTITQKWNGDKDQTPLLTLMFEHCDIESCAAVALGFILNAGYIEDISFVNCHFKDDGAEIIEDSLKGNQSLKNVHFKFDYSSGRARFMEGVLAMLGTNQKILKLSLDMTNDPNCWDIYSSVESSSTLQSLQLYHALLDVPSVLAVVKMCQDVKSLKNVSFKHCDFTRSGIKLFIEQLSKYISLDDLNIEFCKMTEPLLPFALNWRGVKVTNLCLAGNSFRQASISSSFEEIAVNNNIQCLDLSLVMDRDDDFQSMCDFLISGNSGPATLTLREVKRHAPMIIESLQRSTKLRVLTIGDIDETGLVLFAQGLSSMTSLRQLNIDYHQDVDNHYSENFFKSVRDSLEVNTTLWSLSLRGIDSDDAMAKSYLPRIRYLLAMNRVGRSSLFTANVPVGIWTHILAKCPKDPDGILFVLTGKPELLARPSRKRSRCELSREVIRLIKQMISI